MVSNAIYTYIYKDYKSPEIFFVTWHILNNQMKQEPKQTCENNMSKYLIRIKKQDYFKMCVFGLCHVKIGN